MTALNPPGYLENGGANVDASILRRVTKALRISQGVATSADLTVSQNGTPNMSVNVAAGTCIIDGTTTPASQGSYVCTNDATVNLAIAAADPTNPRIDIVVAEIEDSVYSGSNNDWKLAVVTGTPAPSPSAPATPANSIVLAQVAVAANASSIGNANITDERPLVVNLQAQSATVATAQSTTSTTYTDLATAGPSVTLVTGTKVIVSIYANMSNNTVNDRSFMGFAVSGATTIAASDGMDIQHLSTVANGDESLGATFLVTGLTPGSNTFTMKYAAQAGTSTFTNRQITVQTIPS